jgi:protein-S-isoprenylcysteine O-methyltransferase Ste14
MPDGDEENWGDANALLTRWRPEPVERRHARDSRDDQLFVAALVFMGAVVLLALVPLAVDPPPDAGGEPPAWRAVTGLVIAGVGLLFVLVAAALRLPRRRPPMARGSPLRELSARQD